MHRLSCQVFGLASVDIKTATCILAAVWDWLYKGVGAAVLVRGIKKALKEGVPELKHACIADV